MFSLFFFFFQAEDGIRDLTVTGVQTCALPISFAVLGGRSHLAQPSQCPQSDVRCAGTSLDYLQNPPERKSSVLQRRLEPPFGCLIPSQNEWPATRCVRSKDEAGHPH